VLVLARRLGQTVVLPGLGITVQVLGIKGNVVRLGISAPPDVAVLREELVDNPARNAAPQEPEPCAA